VICLQIRSFPRKRKSSATCAESCCAAPGFPPSRGRAEWFFRFTRTALALGLLLFATSPAAAADFYAGKTVNFIVGTDVGGGFSIYGRTIGKYLPRYIPGNPTVVVKNMPGAGGATASAWLYRIAPKDGTAIASVSPNAILGKLLDDSQTQYDPSRFAYLAGAERGTRLCMTFQHSKVKTLDDALTHKAVIGATSAGSPTREYAAMIKHATGAKFEIVSGYKGPPELFIAMERGEIDGVCGLDWSALKSQQPEWLKERKLNLLVQGALEGDPELLALGVSTPWRYIKDDVDRRAVELMVSFQQAFGKSYMAPPGVPAEQIKILRDAFNAALKDRELLAEAERLSIEIAPQSGEKVQRLVESAFSAPAHVVDRLKKIVEP
jgi:tripartite-type tricarboxylate transporter receptor subunit TctC